MIKNNSSTLLQASTRSKPGNSRLQATNKKHKTSHIQTAGLPPKPINMNMNSFIDIAMSKTKSIKIPIKLSWPCHLWETHHLSNIYQKDGTLFLLVFPFHPHTVLILKGHLIGAALQFLNKIYLWSKSNPTLNLMHWTHYKLHQSLLTLFRKIMLLISAKKLNLINLELNIIMNHMKVNNHKLGRLLPTMLMMGTSRSYSQNKTKLLNRSPCIIKSSNNICTLTSKNILPSNSFQLHFLLIKSQIINKCTSFIPRNSLFLVIQIISTQFNKNPSSTKDSLCTKSFF